MNHEVLLTEEFCKEAIRKVHNNEIENMTADEARYLIYFNENDECVDEGSKMVVTCGDLTCFNPAHVKILPPLKH